MTMKGLRLDCPPPHSCFLLSFSSHFQCGRLLLFVRSRSTCQGRKKGDFPTSLSVTLSSLFVAYHKPRWLHVWPQIINVAVELMGGGWLVSLGYLIKFPSDTSWLNKHTHTKYFLYPMFMMSLYFTAPNISVFSAHFLTLS